MTCTCDNSIILVSVIGVGAMDRRRGPTQGSGSVSKAVGIGVLVGLVISVAIFVHNRQIDDLKIQLQAQIEDHVSLSSKN